MFSSVRRNVGLALCATALLSLPIFLLSVRRAAGALSGFSRPLVEPISLIGSLRDASNNPIAGATVYLYTAELRTGPATVCPSCYPDCKKQAVSDANGTFTFSDLDPALLFRVVVVGKGYQPIAVDKVDPAKGELAVTLSPKAGTEEPGRFTVRGRLVGPTGTPLVGAEVEENAVKWGGSTGFGYNPTREPSVLTDEAGEFTFHCLKTLESTDENGKKTQEPVSALQVFVKARDHARAKVWLKPDAPDIQTVTLATGATVQGMVRGATGVPVPGVRVILSQKDRNAETYLRAYEIYTGADGAFSLPNIPQDDAFGITVSMESLLPIGRAAPVHFFRIEKDQAEVRNLNLTLQGAGTITGRVLMPNNQPIPDNIKINLSREDSWDSQSATLPPNGQFSFTGVPPGETVGLSFVIPGYTVAPDNPNTPVRPWVSVEVKMPSPAKTVPLTIRLVPADKKNAP